MDGNAGGKVGLLIPKPASFSVLRWYTGRFQPGYGGTDAVGLNLKDCLLLLACVRPGGSRPRKRNLYK